MHMQHQPVLVQSNLSQVYMYPIPRYDPPRIPVVSQPSVCYVAYQQQPHHQPQSHHQSLYFMYQQKSYIHEPDCHSLHHHPPPPRSFPNIPFPLTLSSSTLSSVSPHSPSSLGFTITDDSHYVLMNPVPNTNYHPPENDFVPNQVSCLPQPLNLQHSENLSGHLGLANDHGSSVSSLENSTATFIYDSQGQVLGSEDPQESSFYRPDSSLHSFAPQSDLNSFDHPHTVSAPSLAPLHQLTHDTACTPPQAYNHFKSYQELRILSPALQQTRSLNTTSQVGTTPRFYRRPKHLPLPSNHSQLSTIPSPSRPSLASPRRRYCEIKTASDEKQVIRRKTKSLAQVTAPPAPPAPSAGPYRPIPHDHQFVENDKEKYSVLQVAFLSRIDPFVSQNRKRRSKPVYYDDQHPTVGSPFYSTSSHNILIDDYIRRLLTYTYCSDACFVAALYYLDRLAISHDSFRLNVKNLRRLAVTALILAIKYNDDHYYGNTYYAQVAGISLPELNQLELVLLHHLDFKLHISAYDFERFQEKLIQEAIDSNHLSTDQHHLTYTESSAPNQEIQHSNPQSFYQTQENAHVLPKDHQLHYVHQQIPQILNTDASYPPLVQQKQQQIQQVYPPQTQAQIESQIQLTSSQTQDSFPVYQVSQLLQPQHSNRQSSRHSSSLVKHQVDEPQQQQSQATQAHSQPQSYSAPSNAQYYMPTEHQRYQQVQYYLAHQYYVNAQQQQQLMLQQQRLVQQHQAYTVYVSAHGHQYLMAQPYVQGYPVYPF